MDGGDIKLSAGNVTGHSRIGGAVSIQSGSSERHKSGDVVLSTPDGDIFSEFSGDVSIKTGSLKNKKYGMSGTLSLKGGSAAHGSSVKLIAGDSTARDVSGKQLSQVSSFYVPAHS